MLARQRDWNEDVAQLDRVALFLIDANQVIPELGRHRRRNLAGLQAVQSGQELLIEVRVVALDPAEVAAFLPADAVARFALRDVVELPATPRFAAHPPHMLAARG